MNKKVIIITQSISELPFDIKSYRANEYSLLFYRLPELIDEMRKLLDGAIDNSIKYGNPVSDYIPQFFDREGVHSADVSDDLQKTTEENVRKELGDNEEEKGFLDYTADIENSSQIMNNELIMMAEELKEMNLSVENANQDIRNAKNGSGSNAKATYILSVCRRLSKPIEEYALKVRGHVGVISENWALIENGYLSLLDSHYITTPENMVGLKESIDALKELKGSIFISNGQIDGFINVMKNCLGIERRLNKSLNMLIFELEKYLTMTETMSASVDRIVSKSAVVMANQND